MARIVLGVIFASVTFCVNTRAAQDNPSEAKITLSDDLRIQPGLESGQVTVEFHAAFGEPVVRVSLGDGRGKTFAPVFLKRGDDFEYKEAPGGKWRLEFKGKRIKERIGNYVGSLVVEVEMGLAVEGADGRWSDFRPLSNKRQMKIRVRDR